MRILFFGTYDAAVHPRVAVLLEGLRAHFDHVDEINEPLGFGTAERVSTVASPRRLPALGARVLAAWRRLLAAAARLPAPDVVVVGYLGHFDVLLARLRFRRATIVLDYLVSGADTAIDRNIGSPVVRWLLAGLDRLALAAADIVVVDTEDQRQRLPAGKRDDAVIVPVGAPAHWYREPPTRSSDRLGVVFYGLFTPLQGTPTIAAALAELADEAIDVTMIGTGQDYAASREIAAPNTNIEWIDWLDGEDLVDVVSRHDVCLGIFGTTPKAQRVVPNKGFQGAAAGCVVVTSDTKPQRAMLEDAAVYVTAGDSVELAAALRRLAEDPTILERRRRSHRIARERFAAAEVVVPLVDRLGALV